jgi:hypothetical protein
MNINITSDYISLEAFSELLNGTSNIKDVHLICHQAGCPVYVIRDVNNKCAIFWHPSVDKEKDVIRIIVKDNILELIYNDKVEPFEELEDLRRHMMSNHMLGEKPFEEEYLVWSVDTQLRKDSIKIYNRGV